MIHSNAHFDVSFLFFNAYSYRHNNVERWNGKCLDSINAITDDNGKQYEVSGRAASDAFVVSTNKAISRYSACVKTFAYWSPEFLTETTLLNAQTGEMINVDSEFIGNETIKHKGKNVSAWHHRLHGDNLQIDLWYSVDDQWLALESLTESGRIIRYEMP